MPRDCLADASYRAGEVWLQCELTYPLARDAEPASDLRSREKPILHGADGSACETSAEDAPSATSHSDEPAADDGAPAGVADRLETAVEEHREVARVSVDVHVSLWDRVALEDRRSVGGSVGDRRLEKRRGDALSLRRGMDVEADDRPDVLVVDPGQLRRVLQTLEALPRAEPAPTDGNAVEIREQRRLSTFAYLRLELRAIASAMAFPVRLASQVPELAPATAGLRGSSTRARPLEEVDDVRPAIRRAGIGLDAGHQTDPSLTGEHVFV